MIPCDVCGNPQSRRLMISGQMIANLCNEHAIQFNAISLPCITEDCIPCGNIGKCCQTRGEV